MLSLLPRRHWPMLVRALYLESTKLHSWISHPFEPILIRTPPNSLPSTAMLRPSTNMPKRLFPSATQMSIMPPRSGRSSTSIYD